MWCWFINIQQFSWLEKCKIINIWYYFIIYFNILSYVNFQQCIFLTGCPYQQERFWQKTQAVNFAWKGHTLWTPGRVSKIRQFLTNWLFWTLKSIVRSFFFDYCGAFKKAILKNFLEKFTKVLIFTWKKMKCTWLQLLCLRTQHALPTLLEEVVGQQFGPLWKRWSFACCNVQVEKLLQQFSRKCHSRRSSW